MNENLRLLKPFLRGLPIIILSVLLSILAAKKYLNYVVPMYESTAKIKIADSREGVPGEMMFKNLDVFATQNKVSTEIEVLKSSNLIYRTLSKLPFNKEIYRKGEVRTTELYKDSPVNIEGTFNTNKAYDIRYGLKVISDTHFVISNPQNKAKGKIGVFGKPISIDGATFFITLNEAFIKSKKNAKVIDNYEFEFLSKEKLFDKINKDLDIIPIDKDVPVIRINLKSAVPEKASLFVNKLAEMYIQDYIETKYQIANITVKFLKEQIDDADEKLSTSENNIQNYRDDKNITNITQETETDLRRLSQLKINQTNVKMNLNAIRDLNKYIESGKDNYLDLAANFEAFTDLLSTEMIKSIKRLQADKKDLLLYYTPENEKVKIIDKKIKDLTDYQIESIKNTEKNLLVKYNDLSNDIKQAEKAFIGLPEKEKILNILNREFNMNQKNYNFLNEKRIEAEIARAAKIAFHKIISTGEISKTPVSPVKIIIIIVAGFLGFIGSIFFIYIVHLLKAKVNDTFTIERNSTIPIAIATPFIKGAQKTKETFLKEAIKLELKGILEKGNIVVLSSYDDSKDHLFHAKNLVEAFIKQGRKTLVIDTTGDLENHVDPHNYLNYTSPHYLSYTKTFFENEISKRIVDYDICFINNQAVKNQKLALLFMSLANQNLMLIDSRKTAEKTIITIELLKDEYNLPNFWFILNKSDYNPSLISELKKSWQKYRQKLS